MQLTDNPIAQIYLRIYFIRVEVGNNIYRIFSFFDKGNLVVLGNAFQKKTQKHINKKLKKHLK